MVAELRTKAQITIPKSVVSGIGLSVGDEFDVFEKDSMICLLPVTVYPKKYIDELKQEVAKAMGQIEKTNRFPNHNEARNPILQTVQTSA